MKLNIFKMQEGGTIGSSSQAFGLLDYVPFISAANNKVQPTVAATTPQQTQAAEILTDEMKKQLLGKGLTSDVNSFVTEVNNMYRSINLENMFGNSMFNSSNLERQQLMLLARINQIQNNKQMFDDAVKAARTSGGLNELAINEFGRIIAKNNKGKIVQITPEELYNNRSNYIPLTNSSVAEIRANSLAYDTNTFKIIENAVGSNQVDERIRQTINAVNKMREENNIFRSKSELEEVKAGLQLLQDGVYKEKTINENNKSQIDAAVKYLYKSLPDNYINFLRAKAANNGIDPTKGAFELIKDYANAKLDINLVRDIDFDSKASKDYVASSDKSKTMDINNPYMALYNGVGAIKGKITINPGSNKEVKADAFSLNSIPTIDGKIIPTYTNLQQIIDSGLGTISNTDKIYFGSHRINPLNLDKVIYTGQGIKRTILLTDANGNPDITVSARWSDALDYINHYNISDPDEILKVMNNYKVENFYLPTGELDPSKFKMYFVINGAASNEQDVLDEDDILDGTVKPIEEVLKNKDNISNFKTKFRMSSSTEDSIYVPDDIYMGQIYIEDNGTIPTIELFDKALKISSMDGYTQEAKIEAQSRADSMNSNIL